MKKVRAVQAPKEIPELPEKSSYLKGAVVMKLHDETTGRSGAVRLDKDRMMFYAEIGQDDNYRSAESKDGSAVERWLRAQLARTELSARLTWIPVIRVVDTSEEYTYGREKGELMARCSLTVERFYVGLTLDEKEWRSLTWAEGDPDSAAEIPDDRKFAASKSYKPGPKSDDVRKGTLYSDKPFALPMFKKGESVVEYTPAMWEGMRAIVATIKQSRATLAHMLTTKNGMETIRAVGAGERTLALGAGKAE